MKLKILIGSLALIALAACNQSGNEEKKSDKVTTVDTTAKVEQGNGVYFANLKDGDTVKSPVVIQMGVKGMEVAPAGKVVEGQGHHHLIIDGSYVEKGKTVPMDATHLHFGKGQTSDTLKLSPGNHTLTLQFADGVHASYGKDWSKTITINVEK